MSLHAFFGLDTPSCYVVQAEGWSMKDEGVHDSYLMAVDRVVEPASGMVVVAAVDGELTVNRYMHIGNRPRLCRRTRAPVD